MDTFSVKTRSRDQLLSITSQVQQSVRDSGIVSGYVIVYVPHTTAGITINEDADPDVVHDIIDQLDEMVPWSQSFYRHSEGNTAAHIKATMTGSSVTVPIENSRLVLGTWQGIFFCEFDGPRSRNVIVKIIQD